MTDRRALGLSPFVGGFFEAKLDAQERLEAVSVEANLATATTHRRVLIFRAPSGSWEERHRRLRWSELPGPASRSLPTPGTRPGEKSGLACRIERLVAFVQEMPTQGSKPFMNQELLDKVLTGAVWDEFCETLRRTGQLVLASGNDEAFERAEGYRYLARITRHALNTFIDRPDPARPCFNFDSPRIGGDNPDYRYASCAADGRWDYLIRGRRNDAFDIGIGSYYGGLGTKQGLQCSGYLTLNDMTSEADGSFELIASSEKKRGNWLPMKPETNSITVREVLLTRRTDLLAELSIERLGPPGDDVARPEPLEPEALAKALRAAGLFTGGVVQQFMGWTNSFASRPNEIRKLDPELVKLAKGDPGTLYYNGYFTLGDDEALIVDLRPPECEYWNIQVTNHWLESLDYLHYDTHLNHHTATYADDRTVQVVIAKHDPGVPNWIDTVGHDRGCIALRWTKASHDSQPTTRVAKLRDLKGR